MSALAKVGYAMAPYFRVAPNGKLPNLKLVDALKFKHAQGECVNPLLRLKKIVWVLMLSLRLFWSLRTTRTYMS